MPYKLVTLAHGAFVKRFATLPEAVAALDRETQRIAPCAGTPPPLTVDQVCEIRGIDMEKATSALLAGMKRRYKTVRRAFPAVAFVHQRAVELHLDLTQDEDQYSSPELTEYYVAWWIASQPTPYGKVRTVDTTPDRRKTSAAQPRNTKLRRK